MVGTLKGHRRGVWCVCFSPTEQVIATSSGDKSIKLWSLGDLTCLKTFEGHTNSVLCVKFLSLGTQLVSCGSDTLIKIWTIKTSECVSTIEEHDDKVWSVAIKESFATVADNMGIARLEESSPCLLISGSADAKISVFQDCTKETMEAKKSANEERILLQQDLDTFVAKKDYKSAIHLALHLGHGGRLAMLFQEILNSGQLSFASSGVDVIISKLNDDKLGKLLDFVRQWNTTAKLARVAQAVLHIILKEFHPERLCSLPNIHDILTSVMPYTEKHFQRMDDLLTKTWLLEYTLAQMETIVLNEDEMALR